ncbi:MAG: hypothetical protein QOG34_541 [Frankiaceae bacterium]|nr:hypothetical protein [Frankiaceae bacterium]
MLDTIFDTLNDVQTGSVDPLICPIFVTLGQITGGSVFGILQIRPDGDLYVAQAVGGSYWQVYDCPPYGDGPGVLTVHIAWSQLRVYTELPQL